MGDSATISTVTMGIITVTYSIPVSYTGHSSILPISNANTLGVANFNVGGNTNYIMSLEKYLISNNTHNSHVDIISRIPGSDIGPDFQPIGSVVAASNCNDINQNLSWSLLLEMLANNCSLDLLETRLKSAKSTLTQTEGSSAGQCPYLEFGPENAKKRLYISSTAPVNGSGGNEIPDGSIGIGW